MTLAGDRSGRRAHRALRHRIRSHEQALDREAAARSQAKDVTAEAELAQAELEAELQSVDPRAKRRGSLPLAGALAGLFALFDVGPAWWAADALRGGWWQTGLVTFLLVAGLAGFAALISYFEHDHRRVSLRLAIAAAVALVVVESALRLDYLLTTSTSHLGRAASEVGLLALVTGGLLWMSYVVLHRAESVDVYRLRRAKEALEREANALREEARAASETRTNNELGLLVLGYGPSETLQEMWESLKHRAIDTGRRNDIQTRSEQDQADGDSKAQPPPSA
jgi:hypothetical protein